MFLRWLRGLIVATGLFFVVLVVPAYTQVQHRTEISGRVIDANNEPVVAMMVEVHGWNGATLASELTNAAGRFDLMVDSEGPFQLEVGPDGASNPLPVQGNSQLNLEIKLPSGESPSNSVSQPSISLNDLEASGTAKSRLAEADKELRKFNLAKAWKLVNEAISAAPNWGKAYLLRGVLSMENHDYTAAQHDLTTAVERDPRSAIALTEMGKLYSTTGQYQLADLYLRRALMNPPVLWPTYFELADLDLKRGNLAEAEKMATYAEFSTPPGPPASHFLAGEAAYRLHDWQTAQIEFRSFLALTPRTAAQTRAISNATSRLAAIAIAQSASRH